MSTQSFPNIEAILNQYQLEEVIEIKPITVGLIHQTLGLVTDSGQRYILQGLHPQLSDDEILADYEAVTTHLAAHQYGGPLLIKTLQGQYTACEEETGLKWRLSTYVPGETYTEIHDDSIAYLGGQGLAEFHHIINHIDYTFASAHPGHDTEGHLQRLIDARDHPHHQEAWSEIAMLGESVISALSETLFPSVLRRQVVHGDPKISNLRFSDHRAVMIDLDTCNVHTRLVDLGDAVRSWCHRPEKDLGERFSLHIWKMMMRGYLSVGQPLDELERLWLPRAGYVITLELASRFARDYLEDHYFSFDSSRFADRRAHNKYRLSAMWNLASEMRDAESLLRDFIDELTQ